MTFHIQRFVTKVQVSDAKAERVVSMPLAEAKSLVAELTILLLQMEEMRAPKTEVDETRVTMSGGSFKDG